MTRASWPSRSWPTDFNATAGCSCPSTSPWTEADYQPAAGIITAAYRAHIDSEINDQYRTNAGSNRFLNNIVRFPGCGVFDTDSSFVAIHRPSNALIGLILCSRVKDDVGHVTQVC